MSLAGIEPEEVFAAQAAELFREQIKRFASWLEANWAITERDNEANEEKISIEQMDGWNRALASIPDALSLYLEPFA